MVVQGYAYGILLTERYSMPCDACHIGKQRRKQRNKERDMKPPIFTNWFMPTSYLFYEKTAPSKRQLLSLW